MATANHVYADHIIEAALQQALNANGGVATDAQLINALATMFSNALVAAGV